HARSQGSKDPIELRGTINRARNNQRGSRLINQDGVNLIDDAVVVPTLHAVFEGTNHVVTQVVNAKSIVGGVGKIAIGGYPAVLGGLRVLCGRGVHATGLQRVEVSRQGGRQACAPRSAHFGDVAEV